MRRIGRQLGTSFLLAAMLGICGPGMLRAQDSGPQIEHAPIVIGLPVPKAGPLGELNLEPNVDISGRRPPQPDHPAAPPPPARPVATGTLLGGLVGQGVIKAGGVLPGGPGTVTKASATQEAGTTMDDVSFGSPGEELPVVNGTSTVAKPIFAQTLNNQSAPGGAVGPSLGSSEVPYFGPPGTVLGGLGANGPAPMGPPPGPNGLPYLGPPGTMLGGPGGGGPIAQPGGPVLNLFGKPGRDGTYFGLGGVDQGSDEGGVGHERVMLAPFAIDTTQPQNDLRFRFDAGYHEQFPDRAEYFWAAAAGAGPKLPERSVNYQDEYFAMEAGSKSLSVNTEIPIRSVDPMDNANTAGLGDMTVTTKTVLLTGNDWQITQLFRTYIPTGDPLKGLGTGHVSLEPGMLFRYKWNNETYFHGELEYWFPLGDNPIYGGEILKYGIGVSHLYYENDSFAVIPTAEFVVSTVFNGAETTPDGALQPVDTMTIVEFHPGIRFVRDTGGDLGLIEYGFSGGFPLTPNRWTDAYLLLEAKFAY